MPWGWECRAKLVKQVPAKPTERRGTHSDAAPGPQQYEPPPLYCGKGYGHIKRAPAYTFGHPTPVNLAKPAATPNAPVFNIRGFTKKGVASIPGGIFGTQLETIGDRTSKPGPAAYAPPGDSRVKRAPAYSCQPPARPPYQPWDMWTCPPNMYLPSVPFKKAPAYSIGNSLKDPPVSNLPGPGDHDPNFSCRQRKPPAFSFGHPYQPQVPPDHPPPNRYCEKKFMVQKRTIPAPSFGIRHTPYLGEFPTCLKPSNLDLIASERGKMVGHLIRHDNFIGNIMEGKINGKRGRGRPRKSYMSQVMEYVGAVSYQDTKRLASDRQRWRQLHQAAPTRALLLSDR